MDRRSTNGSCRLSLTTLQNRFLQRQTPFKRVESFSQQQLSRSTSRQLIYRNGHFIIVEHLIQNACGALLDQFQNRLYLLLICKTYNLLIEYSVYYLLSPFVFPFIFYFLSWFEFWVWLCPVLFCSSLLM